MPWLLPIALCACGVSTPTTTESTLADTTTGSQDSAESAKSGAAKKGEESLADKLQDAEFAVHEAALELRVKEFDRDLKLRKAEHDVELKTHALDLAKKVLDHFEKHEKPVQLDKSKLTLDRARHSRELAADELGELEAMYAEEDLAEATKELVLKRGRRNLEFRERELKFAEREGPQRSSSSSCRRISQRSSRQS